MARLGSPGWNRHFRGAIIGDFIPSASNPPLVDGGSNPILKGGVFCGRLGSRLGSAQLAALAQLVRARSW